MEKICKRMVKTSNHKEQTMLDKIVRIIAVFFILWFILWAITGAKGAEYIFCEPFPECICEEVE